MPSYQSNDNLIRPDDPDNDPDPDTEPPTPLSSYPTYPSPRVSFTRRKSTPPCRSRSQLILSHPLWYKNSLLASAGYLEFANAGDFAANVWNEVPVPRHAVILMAIGGPLALCMSLVALRDGLLSWRNVRLLRTERRHLLAMKHDLLSRATIDNPRDVEEGLPAPIIPALDNSAEDMVRLIDSRLGVSHRELGTELVDRIAMDVLLGIGALIVGTGTLMAIWGAHPTVHKASNLLSGFAGNAFAAVFGLLNAIWSVYLVVRFARHDRACRRPQQPGSANVAPFRDKLHTRFVRLQWHAVVSGLTGLVAGMASMVTARMWWGYVVLVPCTILQVACNRLWRIHLGYDRPVVSARPWGVFGSEKVVDTGTTEKTPSSPQGRCVDEPEPHTLLLTSLVDTIAARNAISPSACPGDIETVDRSSLDSAIRFIIEHNVFDSLCDWLAHARCVPDDLRRAIFGPLSTSPASRGENEEEEEVSLGPDDLLRQVPAAREEVVRDLFLVFLEECAAEVLLCRERYLLEVVGYAVYRFD